MANKELEKYIKKMHKMGYSDERVYEEMKRSGWTYKQIEEEASRYAEELTGRNSGHRSKTILVAFFLFIVFALAVVGFFYFIK